MPRKETSKYQNVFLFKKLNRSRFSKDSERQEACVVGGLRAVRARCQIKSHSVYLGDTIPSTQQT